MTGAPVITRLEGHHPLRLLRSFVDTVRNPIAALPPEIYDSGAHIVRAGRQQVLYLSDPAAIQEALSAHAGRLRKSDAMLRALTPAVGEGLLTADGAHWRWQRQAMAAAFRPQATDSLAPRMLACAGRAADALAAQAGDVVAIDAAMMRLTYDILIETMLSGQAVAGIDTGFVLRAVTRFLEQTGWSMAGAILGLPDWMPHPDRTGARRAARRLREMLMAMLARRRDELAAGGAQRGDLLDRLLDARDPESGRAMDDSEIVDNLITFVAAGHETTAQALGWTLDLLARHPRVMAEVSAEIDAVARGGCVLPEHLVHLVLTRRVLEEGMRLFPPAPMIGREVQDGFALERLGGLEVEPGATIIVPIWAVHRHRRLWDEPGQFDPDRFLPERLASRHRYTWLPFGVGPRVCIGAGFAMLEGMAILAALMARLRFVPADPSTPAPRMAITLRPATPLRLRPLLRG